MQTQIPCEDSSFCWFKGIFITRNSTLVILHLSFNFARSLHSLFLLSSLSSLSSFSCLSSSPSGERFRQLEMVKTQKITIKQQEQSNAINKFGYHLRQRSRSAFAPALTAVFFVPKDLRICSQHVFAVLSISAKQLERRTLPLLHSTSHALQRPL